MESNFAPSIKGYGICGALYTAEPLDACSSLTNFALIIRGGCTFDEKVRKAQNAGFKEATVYDDEDGGSLVSMAGNSDGIKILPVSLPSSCPCVCCRRRALVVAVVPLPSLLPSCPCRRRRALAVVVAVVPLPSSSSSCPCRRRRALAAVVVPVSLPSSSPSCPCRRRRARVFAVVVVPLPSPSCPCLCRRRRALAVVVAVVPLPSPSCPYRHCRRRALAVAVAVVPLPSSSPSCPYRRRALPTDVLLLRPCCACTHPCRLQRPCRVVPCTTLSPVAVASLCHLLIFCANSKGSTFQSLGGGVKESLLG
ncbi:hypothetical protein QJS04_geneDACA019908 [Acorus gramineus]|uniref:PA domain-containing protein n=1 Tax=Acorus gramineus TaxID=55184 RepID=A0AAV9A0A5_ACOGR|nr:hypothetical protein QJS04_geneDACA019908 [Acorus gramineus]